MTSRPLDADAPSFSSASAELERRVVQRRDDAIDRLIAAQAQQQAGQESLAEAVRGIASMVQTGAAETTTLRNALASFAAAATTQGSGQQSTVSTVQLDAHSIQELARSSTSANPQNQEYKLQPETAKLVEKAVLKEKDTRTKAGKAAAAAESLNALDTPANSSEPLPPDHPLRSSRFKLQGYDGKWKEEDGKPNAKSVELQKKLDDFMRQAVVCATPLLIEWKRYAARQFEAENDAVRAKLQDDIKVLFSAADLQSFREKELTHALKEFDDDVEKAVKAAATKRQAEITAASENAERLEQGRIASLKDRSEKSIAAAIEHKVKEQALLITGKVLARVAAGGDGEMDLEISTEPTPAEMQAQIDETESIVRGAIDPKARQSKNGGAPRPTQPAERNQKSTGEKKKKRRGKRGSGKGGGRA